jgi:Spy/CpxP family protein refolding chaperone
VNYWKVILATLVIFGAGVITGALLVNSANNAATTTATPQGPIVPIHVVPPGNAVTSTNAPTEGSNPPNWNRMKKDFLSRYGKQLDLTAEQYQKIETILGDSQKRTKDISDKIAPDLRDEVHKTRVLIQAELNPEQKKKFEELLRPKGKKKEEMHSGKGTNHPPAAVSATSTNNAAPQ